MRKTFLMAMAFSLSLGAFANEQAAELFKARGADKNNALAAADMVRELAKEATGEEKATLKTREAEYIYFYGQRVASKDSKKKVHTRGFKAAEVAISLLKANGVKEEEKSKLATAHYFFAINLGKWGEANGVLSSLSKWPELKGHLDAIDALDKTVEEYGSSRTRARALHKLPWGDKEEAEKILREASEATMSDIIDLSTNSTAVFFYLDILVKNDNTDTFCEVYDNFLELSDFSDEELLEYNPTKLPETKTDLKNFLENKEFEEKVVKYYDRNC